MLDTSFELHRNERLAYCPIFDDKPAHRDPCVLVQKSRPHRSCLAQLAPYPASIDDDIARAIPERWDQRTSGPGTQE